MARDSWESGRPRSPQFPGTIASSCCCCCWPIDFGHVTTQTHTYIHTRQPGPDEHRPLPYRNFLLACRYIQPLTRIMATRRLVTFYDVRPSDWPTDRTANRLQHRFTAQRPPRVDSLPLAIRNCAPNCVNKSCFSRKDLHRVSRRKS